MASDREIVLGVGGGIAAYKSCDLLRRLQDHGFAVTVVPTPSSLNFVGAATWEALSGRPVTSSVWERVDEVRHVLLGKNANAIIIAPATADLIARIAVGRADDLLTNVVLASKAPIFLVPAMHPEMWKNAATTSNVKALRARGYFVMEPEVGRLTGSDVGQGRFPEVGSIVTSFKGFLGDKLDLRGRKVLITAGGTREAIDPVRYIGNRSSGKQGVAIAKAAFSRGAEVTLILANSDEVIGSGIEVVRVETAAQMGAAVESIFAATDLLFMAAAVADARPTNLSQEKIKKDNLSSISLVENPDILKALSAIKGKQIICAFAAETNSDVLAAGQKMRDKGADLIYLNDVSEGQIFGSEQTSGHIIDANGLHASYRDITKDTLAHHLLDTAVDKLG